MTWARLIRLARDAVTEERGDFLFGGPEVKIESPPPAPGAPPITAQEQELLNLEREIGLLNLEIQREQQTQDQAVRAALEKQLGGPLSDVLATQIANTTRFQNTLQGVQRLALEQAGQERAAFINATGMTPEEAQAQEAAWQLRIRGPLQERFERGLRGELPVSPALERSIDDQRMELEGTLLQQYGPGALLPSPGNPAMAALAEFDKRAIELRTRAKEGAISEAEQFGFSLMPATERIRRARETSLQGAGTPALPGMLPSPLSPVMARQFLQTPPQFGTVRGALQGERAFQFAPQLQGYQNQVGFTNAVNQARLGAAGAQAQAQGALLSSLVGAGGTLGAAYWTRGNRGPNIYNMFGGGGGGGGYGYWPGE